eukprot:UC4_evm1s1048
MADIDLAVALVPSHGTTNTGVPPLTKRPRNPSTDRSSLDAPSLVYVGTYNRFDNLAHAPSGTPASKGLVSFSLDPMAMSSPSQTDKSVLTRIGDHHHDKCYNPAFLRYHPTKNILYACTESIYEDGEIFAFKVDPTSGELEFISRQSAGGKSTCYITLDKDLNNMLVTNYWDASLAVLGLNDDGTLQPLKHIGRPWGHSGMVSKNLEEHLASRQAEPHSHAIVLHEPGNGASDDPVAFVPDLGKDVVHQFQFSDGELKEIAEVPVEKGGGPRYIEFHPDHPWAFVVNELTCTVQVFDISSQPLQHGTGAGGFLKESQVISTIPENFNKKSTCGRITIDPSGNYVVVSNRGHDSLAFFRIDKKNGKLEKPSFVKTRGRTPRHFQFTGCGRFIVVANQDSDNLAVFRFDHETGKADCVQLVENVPSPNFVCIYRPH